MWLLPLYLIPSHCPTLVWKHSLILSSHLLLIPLDVMSFSFWISLRFVSSNLFFLPFFSCHIYNLFDWICCKSVESCPTFGQNFFQQVFIVWVSWFHSFFYNSNDIFNDIILPDFHDLFSVRVLSITLTVLSIEYCACSA